MRKKHPKGEGTQRPHEWESEENDRCLVCGRNTNGKAICTDPNCAAELAMG